MARGLESRSKQQIMTTKPLTTIQMERSDPRLAKDYGGEAPRLPRKATDDASRFTMAADYARQDDGHRQKEKSIILA
jgi:hypothetical protein